MEHRFFAEPKKQKILLYLGVAFFIIPISSALFVPYSSESLIPAISIMVILAAVPALYFINTAIKISKNPTVVITENEIILSQPFERKMAVAFSSIKSIKESSNKGIKLNMGLMKNTRINAGILSEADRQKLINILNEKASGLSETQ